MNVTVRTAFVGWVIEGGGEGAGEAAITFTGDANGDGLPDGLAWLLGAANPSTNATDLLPVPHQNNGTLAVSFTYLVPAERGAATLRLQYSTTLEADSWTDIAIPGGSGTVGGVDFVIAPVPDTDLTHVQATISAGAAGRFFVRLASEGPAS